MHIQTDQTRDDCNTEPSAEEWSRIIHLSDLAERLCKQANAWQGDRDKQAAEDLLEAASIVRQQAKALLLTED